LHTALGPLRGLLPLLGGRLRCTCLRLLRLGLCLLCRTRLSLGLSLGLLCTGLLGCGLLLLALLLRAALLLLLLLLLRAGLLLLSLLLALAHVLLGALGVTCRALLVDRRALARLLGLLGGAQPFGGTRVSRWFHSRRCRGRRRCATDLTRLQY
jgi:hypothetical protein